MSKIKVILIDHDTTDLALLENIIYNVDPQAQCISFIHANEAEVILQELIRPPRYIFIGADMARYPALKFLKCFREHPEWGSCRIGIFSNTMPSAVAEVYRNEGADFAFQKPLDEHEGVKMFAPMLNANSANRHSAPRLGTKPG